MEDSAEYFFSNEDLFHETREAGAKPSIVEEFAINGLYGYRSISLSSDNAATILIARNGTGKTTLLGALNALLNLQIFRLKDLEFTDIRCKLRTFSEELVFSRADLDQFLGGVSSADISQLSARSGVEPAALFQFLFSDFETAIDRYYEESGQEKVAIKIIQAFGHDTRLAIRQLKKAYQSLFDRSPELSKLRDQVTDALEGYEVVYLPTYRRVEIPLTDDDDSVYRRRRSKRPGFTVSSAGLHTGEIRFGLADIPQRLSELNDQIIRRSNLGYREISENIINELLQGLDVVEAQSAPSPEDLSLFFSRLEKGSRRLGPMYPVNTPDYRKIITGEGVPTESKKFLSYFLGKLADIIKITTEIEEPVGAFIRSCNRYLLSSEPTTYLQDREFSQDEFSDGKIMIIDRTDLSVSVLSIPADKEVPLDALSSGEKQMISLFARLYLYPGKKIVLIDEPELSLSIDWQRGILVDILLSPNCEQVVAITHSPFVFDNALDEFARPLMVAFQEREEPRLAIEGDDIWDSDEDA